MKKLYLIAPIGAVAAAAAALLLMKKKDGNSAKPEKAKTPSAPAKADIAAKNTVPGVYSFISGFGDAATVEVGVRYDGEKYSFAVAEDDFLAETNDSHVGIVSGGQFNLQLEYAPLHSGESFAALADSYKTKFGTFKPENINGIEGFSYLEGKAIRYCLPVDGDEYSYVVLTAFKGPENDRPFAELPENKELKALLSTVTVRK